jgi:hypothetical protein
MKSLIGFLLSQSLLWAQVVPTPAYYTYTVNTTLASSAGVWTVQQPSNPTKTATFESAYVGCPTGCTFTLERDGTTATATAGTATQWNPNNPTSNMNVFGGSNVGVGTVMGTYFLQSGGWVSIDITGAQFWPVQSGRNISIRTTSMSGQVLLVIKWYEQ